uniref:Uncharacterized protein n=1 Tax=Echeneis naucrates TaxID=173247 RepID=A0A665UJN1_ECHNA
MLNATKILCVILSAYFDTGAFKYLCFTIIVSLYLLIIFVNVLLIVVICVNRSLHEPMHLFLCSHINCWDMAFPFSCHCGFVVIDFTFAAVWECD